MTLVYHHTLNRKALSESYQVAHSGLWLFQRDTEGEQEALAEPWVTADTFLLELPSPLGDREEGPGARAEMKQGTAGTRTPAQKVGVPPPAPFAFSYSHSHRQR